MMENELATFQQSTKMRIAARILNLLADKGWSKSDLAIKMGKNNSEISRWLNGTHNFTLDTLTDISVIFEMDITEFMNDKPNWKPLAI